MLDRKRQHLLKLGFFDHGISGDEAEHRGHVGVDHPSALCNATDSNLRPGDFHFDSDLLLYGVAGHDGLGDGV